MTRVTSKDLWYVDYFVEAQKTEMCEKKTTEEDKDKEEDVNNKTKQKKI